MNFRLYREYGALNSRPVFDAFEQGLKKLGHSVGFHGIPVIWSVLWRGRMQSNCQIYQTAKASNTPVVILEVGTLQRGYTWRVSLNHINRTGVYPTLEIDPSRKHRLIKRQTQKLDSAILIACQHNESLLWEGMPKTTKWIQLQVEQLRKYTDRKIVIRPHPRSPVNVADYKNCTVQVPSRVPNTYDSFDFSTGYYCVVNHSSGPGVLAGLNNVPVICDQSSLAAPIGIQYSQIESIEPVNTHSWEDFISHTEWTLDEISTGYPIHQILSNIHENY